MSYRNIFLGGAIILVGTFVLVFASWKNFVTFQEHRTAIVCSTIGTTSSEHIDCWYRLLNSTLHAHGIDETMKLFQYLYEHFENFSTTGCHRHAHRVGDMVYYELYRNTQDISAIHFPANSDSCGYGFFHGFIEHLIQDHPQAQFITQTCNYLNRTYGAQFGDIRLTCYHGAGHGLILAQTDRIGKKSWGNAIDYITEPLGKCESLPEALPNEIEQCREGVFNVLFEWMTDSQYGFSYDMHQPFTLCKKLKSQWSRACYYEFAMNLDTASSFDPQKLEKIVSQVTDTDLRHLIFSVGIAGIMQTESATSLGYSEITNSCLQLPHEYWIPCVKSVEHGLFEHGDPQREFVKGSALCNLDVLIEGSLKAACWSEYGISIRRFYGEDRQREMCASVPATYEKSCLSGLSNSDNSHTGKK